MNTTSHRSFFGRVAAVVGVATLAVTLSGVTASAATLTQSTQPHRISFAPGTDHATVTGTFRPGSFDTWVLRAGAGQSMTVQMDPPGLAASVGVFAPDGSPLPGGPGDVVTYSLPATGDYRIEVGGGHGDTSPTYSMTVTIPPLAHNTTQRISFAAGADHATVQGTFREAASDTWVVRAGAGQYMTVRIDPPGLAASVGVFAPNGAQLPGGPADIVTYALPATGDYRIVVSGGRSDASPTYSMTVTIPPIRHDAPYRISFAPGTDHATVTGTFRPGAFDTFVLRAGAGRSMTVQIDPPGLGASVGVFAPDGSPLPGGPGDVVTYSLPANGDYKIEIGGGRGDASPTYSMTVTIPA